MAHDVLIVDDEADIRLMIAGVLEDEGYVCRGAATSQEALAAVRDRAPSVVLLDIWLENSAQDGLELLETIVAEDPYIPVVMISGHGTIESAVRAIQNGAHDFIEKPFQSDRLVVCVDRAAEAGVLRRENAELRLRAGREAELVGESQPIQQLRQSIDKVAPTGSRVLISGPPGAGKEVAARMLHNRSRRATGAFVVLNCAVMHPDRLETELFGVAAGAREDEGAKPGTFERADGGTLVLDEVADMPLETQGKIVRALQDQRFMRVGGSRAIEADVRVIAASNRDLDQLMAEGSFRQDLYYRLNVVPLRVPPLRERREDIPLLVERFIARAAAAAGLPERRLDDDAMAALQAYDWPGNVRQLRNIIDWLLIMAPGDASEPVRADMLPPDIGAEAPAALRTNGDSEIMALPLREAREVFERQYLEAQMMRFGGNISRTAAFVGMERSALHRKLRSLGISTTAERE